MLFKPVTEQPKPEPQNQNIFADSRFETYGDNIIPAGKYSPQSLPPETAALINRLDIEALPFNTDMKEIVAKLQQETLTEVVSKGIDVNAVPLKKITNLSQLSAEEQALLKSVLGQVKDEIVAAKIAPPDGVRTFATAEEFAKHVHNRLASIDVAGYGEDEVKTPEPVGEKKMLLQEPVNMVQSGTAPVEPEEMDSEAAHPLLRKRPPKGMTHCPHCNLSLFLDPAAISDDQKQEFIYSVIHNQPYTETLNFFGDHIKVKFVSLTTYEQDFLTAVNNEIGDRKDVSESAKYDFYLRSYLVFALAELTIAGTVHSFPRLKAVEKISDGVDNVLTRCNEVISKLSGGEILNLLCTEALKFNYRYRRLVVMGLQADFWKPIR